MKWYETEGAKQYRGSKQEDSEGSEESKRGLDMWVRVKRLKLA